MDPGGGNRAAVLILLERGISSVFRDAQGSASGTSVDPRAFKLDLTGHSELGYLPGLPRWRMKTITLSSLVPHLFTTSSALPHVLETRAQENIWLCNIARYGRKGSSVG